MQQKTNYWAEFGKYSLAFIALFLSILFGGYVFMKLWQWFIVYAFSVNPLTLIESIGVLFFLRMLKHDIKSQKGFSWEVFGKTFLSTMVYYLLLLCLGYLITLFQ